MLANHELDLLKEFVAAQNRVATVLEALLGVVNPEAAAQLQVGAATPPHPAQPPAVGGGIAQPLAAPGRQTPAQPPAPGAPPIRHAVPPQPAPTAPAIPPGPAAAMGHGAPQGAPAPNEAQLAQMIASGLAPSVAEGAPLHIGPGDLQEPQRRGFGAQPPPPGAPAVRPAPGMVQPGANGAPAQYVPPPGPYSGQAVQHELTQETAPQTAYIPQRPPDIVSQTPGTAPPAKKRAPRKAKGSKKKRKRS